MSNIDYEQLYVESCRNQRENLFSASHDHEKRLTRIEERQKLEAEHAKEKHDALAEETDKQDVKLKDHDSFKIKAVAGLTVIAGIAKLIYDKIQLP